MQPDHLYLFAGLNASFLRGKFPVIPLAGLIWEPNDKWKVLGILPEPRVIYSPNDKIDFWAGGQLTGGSFRTDRDNTIVPTKLNGAEVDYSEYRVGGGFIYSPCNNVSIDLGGGYAIRREFDFHRADIRYKADGAPYLRLEFKAILSSPWRGRALFEIRLNTAGTTGTRRPSRRIGTAPIRRNE